MGARTIDARTGLRIKQELVVGLKTNSGLNMAYTIDVSRGGVKLGRPQLVLPVGEPVELVIEKRGEKIPFAGHVARSDGNYYINRISRNANSYFIKIDDSRYSNFVMDNYFI